MTARRLGDDERRFLQTLNVHGAWVLGGPWIWGDNATTTKMLGALADRDLVKVDADGKTWRLTVAGREALRAGR